MTTKNKKKIDEHWIERALQQEQNAQIVADRYMAQIGQSLADYKHQLVSEIEKFYARYAVDNKMTHAEAKQYLTDKERREFKHVTLERFREMALNPDTPTPLLDSLGYRHRISRKEALLAEIERLTAELYGKPDGIHDKVTEALSDVYIKGKIHQAKNLAHFGIIEKPILGVDAVKHKMASNWSGRTFSENVWVHREVAYKAISDVLNKGLTGGWSIDRMARALSDRTGVAYHRADTLVRTETTFYNNLATLDTIKELGGDHYEIVAVLDSRTSEICRLENHEVHSVKEYEPGRTAPPFHVRCRSTIRPAVKSDKPSPYFDILQNDGSVKLATEQRSLDEIFAGWEREGEAVLRGVKKSSKTTSDILFEERLPKAAEEKVLSHFDFFNNSRIVLRPERLEHILEGHSDIGDDVEGIVHGVIKKPDMILIDHKNDNSILVLGKSLENSVNVVVRLSNTDFDNSIITAMRVSDKTLKRLLKKNKKIYDKNE